MVRAIALACLLLLLATNTGAQETLTRSASMSPDAAGDGRIAIDLAGDIWIVPPGGGDATRATADQASASRPRWSPDGQRIAFQSTEDGAHSIWVQDLSGNRLHRISRDEAFEMHPEWHPDAERLVYARDETGTGFDLWEVDLPTGLHWRLSHRPGDETEAAWSSDGRDLLYIHHDQGSWSLILRRHGEPEETLLSTTDRIAAPSWRPDGSLVTFLRVLESSIALEMVILSEPRLLRTYADNEAFTLAPVSWLDRQRMVYAANEGIRRRAFNSWTSGPIPFRVTLEPAPVVEPVLAERRELELIDEPPGRLIVHAERLFDGLGDGYLDDRDIVIEGGRITSVGPHDDHDGAIVIDMGDLTVLPGFIDARAALPADLSVHTGALLLTMGVTTLVGDTGDAANLNQVWSSKQLPGPRLLSDDGRLSAEVVAIADSMTPGVAELLRSRQARLFGAHDPVPRRFADPPTIEIGSTSRVLASRGNQLRPGLALHAELRALAAAGLEPAQALRAAGANAAAALGLDPFLGRISVGAVADLVFVDGDPLEEVADALNVVAVVRNGRFFSVAGLIDRFESAETVE